MYSKLSCDILLRRHWLSSNRKLQSKEAHQKWLFWQYWSGIDDFSARLYVYRDELLGRSTIKTWRIFTYSEMFHKLCQSSVLVWRICIFAKTASVNQMGRRRRRIFLTSQVWRFDGTGNTCSWSTFSGTKINMLCWLAPAEDVLFKEEDKEKKCDP